MSITRWLLVFLAALAIAVVLLLEEPSCRHAELPERPGVPSLASPETTPATLEGIRAPGKEPPVEEDEAHEVDLTGRVVAAGTRAVIPSAWIRVECAGTPRAQTTTAADGRFRVRFVEDAKPPGGMRARPRCVVHVGATGRSTVVAVPPDWGVLGPEDLGEIALPEAWTVAGSVRGESGEPVPRARIELLSLEPPTESACRTGAWHEVGSTQRSEGDAAGRFRFEGVAPGPFRLEIQAEGYVTSYMRGSLRADETPVEVRLQRGKSVRVSVIDEAGNPVAGARVGLYPGFRVTFAGHYKTHLNLDRKTTTDSRGRCVLTGLDERNYHIAAWASGRGADDAYMLAGWSEARLRLRPGWSSSRYVYEAGPGYSRFYPPGIRGRFPWVHTGPQQRSPRLPARRTPLPSAAPPAPREEKKPPPHLGWLRVRVVSAGGIPIPRAYVRFEGPETESEITEDDGTERFALAPGRYDYRVSPMDFGTEEGDVRGTLDVRGGVTASVEFEMPRIHAVRVEVRDAGGAPVPRAQVEVLQGDEDNREWADPNGMVDLFAEEGERLALLCRLDDQPAAFVSNVPLPSRTPVILQPPKGGEIRGRVVDSGGAPVFGVCVVLRREGLAPIGEERWVAWTGDGGYFHLRGPTAAWYRVEAVHDAYGRARARVDASRPGADVRLRLPPLVRLQGRVLDADGQGISRARIEVQGERGGRVGTDEDGRFSITIPDPTAPTKVRVRHTEFLSASIDVSDPTEELSVRLTRREAPGPPGEGRHPPR